MTFGEKSVLFNEKLFAQWLSKQRPWATYGLIFTNVAVFVAMCVLIGKAAFLSAPSTQQLLEWGANCAPVTLQAQEWRLVTCGFLHLGIMHLVMNMSVLWLVGRICERLFGSLRFLIIYFLSGIGAALFTDLSYLLIAPIISAGASGSICGLLGAYFWFIQAHKQEFEPGIYKSMIRKFAEYTIVIVVFGVFVHADQAAHFGGVLFGGILGAALLPQSKGACAPGPRQLVIVSLICLSLCGLLFVEASGAVDANDYVQLYRAQVLRDNRHEEEAATCLKDVLKHHPNNVDAYVSLSTCAMELNDSKSALEAAIAALKLKPDSAAALYAHAATANRVGDYDTCVNECAKIQANSPYFKLSRSLMIQVVGAQGDLDLALKEAEENNDTAELAKMSIYLQAGEDAQSKTLASAILKKDPNNMWALLALLELDWSAGNYQKVMKLAQQICHTSKDDYSVFLYTIAAKLSNDAHPNLLLDGNVERTKWTKAIADYLRNRITETQLIDRAQLLDQQTEAHAYIGLNLLAQHRWTQAKPYLEWTVQHGVPTFTEYHLASQELARLKP